MDANSFAQVLGDIFEAIIGAVFLDSGHDLAVVWRVYTGLCPQLDAVVANPVGATHPSPPNSPQPLNMNKLWTAEVAQPEPEPERAAGKPSLDVVVGRA